MPWCTGISPNAFILDSRWTWVVAFVPWCTGIAPNAFILDSRWTWVVTFVPWLLHPQGTKPSMVIQEVDWALETIWTFWSRGNPFVSVRNLACGLPAHSLVHILIETSFLFWIFIFVGHISFRSAAASLIPLTISSTKKEPSKQWYVITLTDSLEKNVTYQVDISFSGNMTTGITQGFFHGSYQLNQTKEQRL